MRLGELLIDQGRGLEALSKLEQAETMLRERRVDNRKHKVRLLMAQALIDMKDRMYIKRARRCLKKILKYEGKMPGAASIRKAKLFDIEAECLEQITLKRLLDDSNNDKTRKKVDLCLARIDDIVVECIGRKDRSNFQRGFKLRSKICKTYRQIYEIKYRGKASKPEDFTEVVIDCKDKEFKAYILLSLSRRYFEEKRPTEAIADFETDNSSDQKTLLKLASTNERLIKTAIKGLSDADLMRSFFDLCCDLEEGKRV